MAGQCGATLLYVSHDGRAGDAVHPAAGNRGHFGMARQAPEIPLDALDSNVRIPVPIYCDNRRVDDRGAGPPALAGLRTAADDSWHFAAGERWRRHVLQPGVYGDVLCDGSAVSLSSDARDWAGTIGCG